MAARSTGAEPPLGAVHTMAGPPPSGRQGYGLPPQGTGSFVDHLPPVAQPVARTVGPLLHAAGVLLLGLGRVAYRAVVYTSPLLIWAALKYLQWQITGVLSKVGRVFKWANWLLKLLPKAPPPAPPP